MLSATRYEKHVVIRNATFRDMDNLIELLDVVYPDMPATNINAIKSRIQQYPEGQFVAILDNKLIGYSASLRISGAIALKKHSWDSISGNGYATTHDPNGDYIYGIETCVDINHQNHVGRHLYNTRKALCLRSGLKGIIFCGRMALLAKEIKQVITPEHYLKLVQSDVLYDPALLFQLHNGFEIIGILEDYLPEDKESLGYAVHLIWHTSSLVY